MSQDLKSAIILSTTSISALLDVAFTELEDAQIVFEYMDFNPKWKGESDVVAKVEDSVLAIEE